MNSNGVKKNGKEGRTMGVEEVKKGARLNHKHLVLENTNSKNMKR